MPTNCRTLLVIFFLAACNHRRLTVDEVIGRNTDAMGGRAALESVQNVEIELHVTDPRFEVDGLYRASKPGRMRIDIQSDGKHVFTEAFDGKTGWQWSEKNGVTLTSAKGTAARRHGVEFPGTLFGLHEMQQRGHRIELIDWEMIEGTNYYVLRLTLNDGYVVNFYVDPSSWLITRRRDVRPLHPDIDPTPTTIEQKRADFRTVSGVKFPFETIETNLATGKKLESTKIKTMKINSPIDQLIFKKP